MPALPFIATDISKIVNLGGVILATPSVGLICSPRNVLIYYVLPVTFDHPENREIKTAGRRLGDFPKNRLWSTHTGKT